MNSDLPGELGSEPGLDRLLRTLASGPTPDELTGEQQAVAMFRANIHPLARDTAELPVTAVPGDQVPPTGHQLGAIRQRARRRLMGPRVRIRLAAATAAVVVGGFAGAAYAAVLPAPVQHVAYQAFHVLGVPDSHHSSSSTGGRNGASSLPGPHRSGGTGPSRSAPSHGASPGASKSASPHPSSGAKTPTPTSGTGNATVTATATAAQIPAGGSDTIDGQLTRAGKAVPGVTVKLWERLALHVKWSLVGQATTGSTGEVAITVPSLDTNATFRLTDPDGRVSPAVRVTVVPEISTSIVQGSAGVKDYLHVTTQFAHTGDTVELEALKNGTWVLVRDQTLNAKKKTTFVIGAKRYSGIELQVVLLATRRHAQAVSSPPVTGPAVA